MKKRFILVILLVSIVGIAHTYPGIIPTIKDNDEGTKVSIEIPGIFFRIGSLFVKKEEREIKYLVSKCRGIKIHVQEGGYYDPGFIDYMLEATEQLKKYDFEEILTVRTPDEAVTILLKDNARGKIKGLVLFADDGETNVFIHLKCNISMDRLIEIAKKNGLGKDTLIEEPTTIVDMI